MLAQLQPRRRDVKTREVFINLWMDKRANPCFLVTRQIMTKTLIVTCALLIMVIFTEGCAYVKKKKRSQNSIHKYSGKEYINVNKWKNNE